MVALVVDYFVEEHQLYLGASQHAKCGDLGLGELMDIGIVPVLVVVQFVTDFELSLGMVDGLGFQNLLFELDFRGGKLERR